MFVLIVVFPVLAKTVFPVGPYFSGGDKFYIAADSQYADLRNSFTAGETVYLKLESTRVINNSSGNSLQIYDYNSNLIQQLSFTQTSFTSPFTFEANFSFPSSSTYYNLVINITSSQRQRLAVQQTIQTQGVEQYFKLFKDTAYTQEHYVFKSTDTVYLKVYAGSSGGKQESQTVYDFQANGLYYGYSSFSQAGNWYTLSLNLGQMSGLTDQSWHILEAGSRWGSRKVFSVGRMFFIDDSLPFSQLTAPVPGEELTGILPVQGSADDASFAYYKLEYEAQSSLGVWQQIGSEVTTPVAAGFLANWDTSSLSPGFYNLKLTVVDQAGNISTSQVNNLFRPSYSGAFSLTVPETVTLSSVPVSSFLQETAGKIGEGTGSNDVKIEDDRGLFEGWSLTMTVTDFFSGTDMVPVTGLTITPGLVTAESGSLDGVTAGPVHTFLSDIDPASIMLAGSGFGNGVYWNDVDLLLQVPAFSKAGNYNAVVTFSLQ